MSIQVLGALAGAAASAGILAAMLGILAANILKDVSDQCCQCCQCWLGWAAARAAINRSAQSPKEAGRLGWAGLGWAGWAGGGAGLRPVRGGGSLYRPAAAGTVSVVSTPPAAPRCVPRHRPARGHENRSLSSLITAASPQPHHRLTAASPQPHRRRYRHLTPPLLLSPHLRPDTRRRLSIVLPHPQQQTRHRSRVTRDT